MKKTLLLMIASILLFFSVSLIVIQLLSQNNIPTPKQKEQEITKVNTIENSLLQVNSATDKAVESNREIFSLIYPVEGKIGLPYSPDNLVYSKTLNEWTIHKGIDIQSPRGTPVKASEAGTIETISETPDKGIEITISHENGYKTIYSNLSSKDMVKPGQKVEKSQVISGIGNTSSFEYHEPDHLHFEIIKDGKHIDPVKELN